MVIRQARSNVVSKTRRLSELAVWALFCLIVFVVYVCARDTTPLTDTRYTLHIALSLLREGNVDLDEYSYAATEGYELRGHRYSYFPLGAPLAITPFALLFDLGSRWFSGYDIYEGFKSSVDWGIVARFQLVLASLFTAVTGGLIYRIGRLSLDRGRAVLLGCIFAFCTSAWSTASRDLWQHTLSILLLTAGLYLLLVAEQQPASLPLVGIALAGSFVVRPTNSIAIAVLTVYVLAHHRSHRLRYLLSMLPIAVGFLALNVAIFGSIVPSYFAPQRLASNPAFAEALLGNLISPARGLLIYSPIILLGIYALPHQPAQSRLVLLNRYLAGVIVLHWLVISSFAHWWGGASYGPRLFTDMTPFWVYLLIPILHRLRWPLTTHTAALTVVLVLLAVISFGMHLRGVFDPRTWDWNGARLHVLPSVDEDPGRVWDWSDPQFWRGWRPAHLAIDPTALCFVGMAGGPNPMPHSLMLRNLGDRDLVWNAEWPQRLYAEPAETRVPALGYGEVHLGVDSGGLAEGLYRLGGVYVTARGQDGSVARQSPVVIPIHLRVLAPGTAPEASPTGGLCSHAASDSWLVVRTTQPGGDQPHVTFGAGWYDLETQGDIHWRWAASPARILINSPAAQRMTLSATILAAYQRAGPVAVGAPFTLTISVGDRASFPVQTVVGEPFVVELALAPGWNAVMLASEAGNVRPANVDPQSGEQRDLSFALGRLDMMLR